MTQASSYTQKIADIICERLANGDSLRTICKSDGMPVMSTVMKWRNDIPSFTEQYARARELQADLIFDELLSIADDGQNDFMEKELRDGRVIEVPDHEHISRSRLRFDARRWVLAKMLPKKYGEKITQEMTGPDGVALNLSDAQLAAALNGLTQNLPQQPTEEYPEDGSDLL